MEANRRRFVMSATLDQLKSTLSRLPEQERAELAQYLLRSLDAEESATEAEWMALAAQRMKDVRAGKVVGIPAEEVLQSLLSRP
jgi:putative addiction module component (TIGR02574 family)